MALRSFSGGCSLWEVFAINPLSLSYKTLLKSKYLQTKRYKCSTGPSPPVNISLHLFQALVLLEFRLHLDFDSEMPLMCICHLKSMSFPCSLKFVCVTVAGPLDSLCSREGVNRSEQIVVYIGCDVVCECKVCKSVAGRRAVVE
ncbi:hypothetical protein P691DRAFT_390448 [Macrolepiota fuliginosa MF-IS2]|uniref:Uncharacterized protein n=1 Tax=Macrolepiota fuliginosa MF-IS2 TaxID=1400762 RepID=A0A9P6BZJ0_9AGAR|nr:hypothetical protein P691DRAFT_390448 [Macrolepiota fuliginosa MF-IS2]